MVNLLNALRSYIHRTEQSELEAIPFEPEENTYMLHLKTSGEKVGEMVLDDSGNLIFFAEFDENDSASKSYIPKEKILEMTKQFINDIFPASADQLYLSAIIDYDEFFVFDYVLKDKKLGLELPNSGISFSILKNGFIMDMSNEMNDGDVIYSKIGLTEKEAKEMYVKSVKLLLKISRYDHETYVSGTDEYQLVYDFISGAATDIKMDGSMTTLEDLGMDPVEFEDLPYIKVEQYSLLTMIGADLMEKVEERELEDSRIEIWSHFPAEQLKDEYDCEELVDIETGIEHVIKIMVDPESGKLKRVMSIPNGSNTERSLTAAQAYSSALKILFSQFPKANQLFKLRVEEPALIDYDDEGDELPPYAYQFIFERFETGIQVDGVSVSIKVSAYSGELCEWTVSDQAHNEFTYLTEKTPVHYDQAIKLYTSSFSMKLQWAKETSDEGTPRYELVFMPEFAGTGGHIHCIDAHTMEPWIVDITGMDEI